VRRSVQVSNLKYLSKKTDIPLVQLTDDFTNTVYGSPEGTTYADLLTKEGIADIATYATGMGPWKNTLIPVDPDTNLLGEPTGVADMIHDAGLAVRTATCQALRQVTCMYDQIKILCLYDAS
jgi:glycerophosphoryl diester phosphodiesterase